MDCQFYYEARGPLRPHAMNSLCAALLLFSFWPLSSLFTTPTAYSDYDPLRRNSIIIMGKIHHQHWWSTNSGTRILFELLISVGPSTFFFKRENTVINTFEAKIREQGQQKRGESKRSFIQRMCHPPNKYEEATSSCSAFNKNGLNCFIYTLLFSILALIIWTFSNCFWYIFQQQNCKWEELSTGSMWFVMLEIWNWQKILPEKNVNCDPYYERLSLYFSQELVTSVSAICIFVCTNYYCWPHKTQLRRWETRETLINVSL